MKMQTIASKKPIDNLAIGKVIEVDGSRFVAELNPQLSELTRVYEGEVYPIGQFGSIVRIHFGTRLIYGMVNRLQMKAEFQAEKGATLTAPADADARVIYADLFGEGHYASEDGKFIFERGVSNYPLPQQDVYLTPTSELQSIYSAGNETGVRLGEHAGSGNAACFADLNELVGKHTAILGATGAGKSGTVAAVIHSILEKREGNWAPRIIVLDPHGEYSNAFPGVEEISADNGLKLPYWLLNYQETLEVFLGKSEKSASAKSAKLKDALLEARKEGAKCLKGLSPESITVNSPIPYELSKIMVEGDIRETIQRMKGDSRYHFMMDEWKGGEEDPLPEIIKTLTGEELRPCIVNLSSVPSEIATTASAFIARVLFDFKSNQTLEERENSPVLLVCEEAHRYVPNSEEAQYRASQNAIRRIAKEGRKYGIGLFLVSQRPGEIETTVLSQCSSWIVLRITNTNDIQQVSTILPDSMSGMTAILSGLRRREAIFAGQAATMPSRILIRDLDAKQLPKSNDIDFDEGWQTTKNAKPTKIDETLKRWRQQGHDTSKGK